MNENIRRLAQQAGFMFWDDEPHRPLGSDIDWAAQYDQEFDAYTRALIREVVSLERSGTNVLEHFGIETSGREIVEVDFSDQELLTYAKIAHDRDITLNKLIEQALVDFILDHEKEQQCASE